MSTGEGPNCQRCGLEIDRPSYPLSGSYCYACEAHINAQVQKPVRAPRRERRRAEALARKVKRAGV